MKHIIWSIGHKLILEDIVEANNCYLYDSKGNKYIDLESGVWCTSVGHSNPRINEAIKSQLNKITHTGYCYGNPIIEETAGRILEITGFNEGKCEFICSGSEAVEYGIRAARAILGKTKTLTFTDSYFGAYGEASKRDSDDWHLYNWMDCSCPHPIGGCTGDCDEYRSIPFEKIRIFLFEPGSSSGLVRFPSKKLIKKIADRIRTNNGIFIINEVTTGIGRTGKWFGYQHYDVLPDIVAIGKGVGNGYPVSITAMSQGVADRLTLTNFLYSQSHQNDPLGARIALEVINTIDEEELLLACTQKGEKLIERLKNVKEQYPIIKDVRGRGLMIAIEFVEQADEIWRAFLENGFVIVKRPDAEILRMDPALTINDDDIELFLSTFESIIENIK